jgi:hypothetical protein
MVFFEKAVCIGLGSLADYLSCAYYASMNKLDLRRKKCSSRKATAGKLVTMKRPADTRRNEAGAAHTIFMKSQRRFSGPLLPA